MHTENKKELALEVIRRLTGVPGCCLQSGLQRSLEASCQCPSGGTVYGCPRKYDRTQTI